MAFLIKIIIENFRTFKYVFENVFKMSAIL